MTRDEDVAAMREDIKNLREMLLEMTKHRDEWREHHAEMCEAIREAIGAVPVVANHEPDDKLEWEE